VDASLLLTASTFLQEGILQRTHAIVEVMLSDGLLSHMVNREDFEVGSSTLTKKTLQAVKKALRDANLQPTDIQGVVMVGGSTRMPHVQTAVANC
jgi:molecular chaperone HscA